MKIISSLSKRIFSINHQENHHESVLHSILLGSIALITVDLIAIAVRYFRFGSDSSSSNPLYVLVLLILFIFLYIISKLGFYKVASIILILGFFIPTALTSITWGIDVMHSLLGYALIIVMAGILVGSLFSLIMTTLISALIITLSYLSQHKIISFDRSWTLNQPGMDDAIVFVISFALIMIITWLYNRQIEKSLKRALDSEAELKKERDLLEIKVKERTKELEKAQLEKLSQVYHFAEFGKLASGIFHDLINPLTAVSLNLNQLKNESSKEVAGAKNHLKQALLATKRMEAFLMAIRKQLQKQETKNIFSINNEIKQSIQIISHKAKTSNVIIKFNCEGNLETYGNPLKFNQAITNIAVNSIDAYENKDTADKIIDISLRKIGNNAVIKVLDRGIGISKEIADKIFDPFFTTKDVEKGTGIGLAITKEIIEEDFGGSILMKSEDNIGTTFTIRLPILNSDSV